MEKTPPAKPDSDRFDRHLAIVRRSFGDILAQYLFRRGMRPGAPDQAPWTKQEFVDRLAGSLGADTISPQTVEDWLNGASLPDEQTEFPAILQLLYGDDPALSGYRTSFADFFEQAKRVERGVLLPQDTIRLGQNPSAGTAIASILGTIIAADPALKLSPDDARDIARLDRDLQTLRAAKPPPDSVTYTETETSFAIVQGQVTDSEVAAQPATAQRHSNVITKIEDLIDACGTRLDNQRSWRRLPQIAKRALEAANTPTIELPDALVDLYDHTVSLGSYVSQDDAMGADKNASDEPLDHDIRRALVDFISSASPWLRSFPSVLAADDARREFLTRPELFEPIRRTLPAAREFLEIAGREGVLSPEDAARATLPIETAQRGGVLGEKAGYRGHGNALGLLTRAATVSIVSLISFYSGAIASDFATKSVLVQRAGSFLARAEEQARQLAASAPEDLRIALENVLKVNRLRQEGDPPPQTPDIMPADGSKPLRPPLQPRVLEAESWPLLATLTGHEGWVYSVGFSPDGARLVSGGRDGTLRLWDAASGALLATLTGHGGPVASVGFSPDGARLVSGGFDGTVRLWDAASGALLATLTGHEGWVTSVGGSPVGARLVSGGRYGTLRLWDAASGALLAKLTGHEGAVRSVGFSPDGARLVSGGDDRTLRLWDAASGALLATLTGHEGWVNSVSFSPVGARLVSGGQDGTVRLWDAALGAPVYGA